MYKWQSKNASRQYNCLSMCISALHFNRISSRKFRTEQDFIGANMPTFCSLFAIDRTLWSNETLVRHCESSSSSASAIFQMNLRSNRKRSWKFLKVKSFFLCKQKLFWKRHSSHSLKHPFLFFTRLTKTRVKKSFAFVTRNANREPSHFLVSFWSNWCVFTTLHYFLIRSWKHSSMGTSMSDQFAQPIPHFARPTTVNNITPKSPLENLVHT